MQNIPLSLMIVFQGRILLQGVLNICVKHPLARFHTQIDIAYSLKHLGNWRLNASQNVLQRVEHEVLSWFLIQLVGLGCAARNFSPGSFTFLVKYGGSDCNWTGI